MKKLAVVLLLALTAQSAQSAILCQSLRDPNYQAVFEGYNCPSGFYMIRMIYR